MPQRKRPRVNQEDIDSAVSQLLDVLDIDSLRDVDRLFALNLLQDYGKWCGITEAAWRSIESDGLTMRQSSGAKGNRHYKMVKSEAIDIFKAGIASKLSLAAKISKFVNQGTAAVTEDADDFDTFDE